MGAFIKIGVISTLALMFSGCGARVPDIQEFWGTPEDARFKVNNISVQVVCELRRAVQKVFWDIENDPLIFAPTPGRATPRPRKLKWFEAWGAQVTLNLNIVENTGVAPGVSFNSIMPNVITTFPTGGNVTSPQSHATALGGSVTATATRTDKLNMFFMVQELKEAYPSRDLTCIPPPTNADLFIQSDLKLYDWLRAALLPYQAYTADYSNTSTDKNAISHQIKFQIVSNGSVNPSWKLVRFSANTGSSPLFSAGRDRSQDLTITFGPTLAPTKKGERPRQLATPAQNTHLATEIGTAVGQALRTPQ